MILVAYALSEAVTPLKAQRRKVPIPQAALTVATSGGVLVWISLRNLCVLGVSAVNKVLEQNHRRGAEDAEVAQR